MIKLIQNEFLKLHAQKTIYILMGVLVLLEGIIAIILKSLLSSNIPPGANTPLGYASFLLPTIIMFTTIFGITIASRTITEEFQKGTIKQLLIRPKKRLSILFAKYITVLLSMVIIIIISTVTASLIGEIMMRGGKTELTPSIFIIKLLYMLPATFFYATLSFFLANVFRKSVLSLIISMFLFFIEGPILYLFMLYAQGIAKYIVLFHLNLNMYDSREIINEGATPLFSEFTLTTSSLFVLASFAVLLIASSVMFQKRDVL
ncbi:MAG TPA: ABC transporter permease [Bacillus sp. (in: Bacteria)]|uniref:ABC transporter, permease protein n=1 Tax=Bacillus thuringiensis TaxID=1428 RepID=A0A9X5RM31_BACTU|nr:MULTISPECIES: ABC transporter permease [Bacillus cereus group]OFC89122.1 ABC transporter, permease protein [Bacillus thuringiensis]SME74036.1 ABC-2 family transporter protein [Bacillus cereus]HCF55078.1 ABC transporter permease [Bacillus sp. (in: firmicutes)]